MLQTTLKKLFDTNAINYKGITINKYTYNWNEFYYDYINDYLPEELLEIIDDLITIYAPK